MINQAIAYIRDYKVEALDAAGAILNSVLYPLPEGFVYLDETVSGILWDAKYATEDNFTGHIVDGYRANRIVCAEKMAEALTKARDIAAEEGYTLLIWDCARPQKAVDRFAEWAQEPEDGLTKEAHYPNLAKTKLFSEGYIAHRSGHSRGCAVDLTLVDKNTQQELDMGGGFDLMDAKSHHGASGLTKEQTQNRNTLKAIMQKAGFKSYSGEWWHYSLKKEPHPNTYYDFTIVETRIPEGFTPIQNGEAKETNEAAEFIAPAPQE